MSEKAKGKKTEANVDSVPWKVRDSLGNEPLKDQFKGFADANSAARKYTRETGVHAEAVRS